MMKQYMKNKSLFLQKEELLSRIAEQHRMWSMVTAF